MHIANNIVQESIKLIYWYFVPVQYSRVWLNVSSPTHAKTLFTVKSANCQPGPQFSINVLFSVIGPLDGVILPMLPLVCCPALGRVHVASITMKIVKLMIKNCLKHIIAIQSPPVELQISGKLSVGNLYLVFIN